MNSCAVAHSRGAQRTCWVGRRRSDGVGGGWRVHVPSRPLQCRWRSLRAALPRKQRVDPCRAGALRVASGRGRCSSACASPVRDCRRGATPAAARDIHHCNGLTAPARPGGTRLYGWGGGSDRGGGTFLDSAPCVVRPRPLGGARFRLRRGCGISSKPTAQFLGRAACPKGAMPTATSAPTSTRAQSQTMGAHGILSHTPRAADAHPRRPHHQEPRHLRPRRRRLRAALAPPQQRYECVALRGARRGLPP